MRSIRLIQLTFFALGILLMAACANEEDPTDQFSSSDGIKPFTEALRNLSQETYKLDGRHTPSSTTVTNVDEDSVSIEWDLTSNFNGVLIFHRAEGSTDWVTRGVSTQNQFQDDGLIASTTYEYIIVPFNSNDLTFSLGQITTYSPIQTTTTTTTTSTTSTTINTTTSTIPSTTTTTIPICQSGTQTWNEAGEYSFTVPAHCDRIWFSAFGAGGSGGQSFSFDGGKGGNGGYSEIDLSTSASTTYRIVVGKGGGCSNDAATESVDSNGCGGPFVGGIAGTVNPIFAVGGAFNFGDDPEGQMGAYSGGKGGGASNPLGGGASVVFDSNNSHLAIAGGGGGGGDSGLQAAPSDGGAGCGGASEARTGSSTSTGGGGGYCKGDVTIAGSGNSGGSGDSSRVSFATGSVPADGKVTAIWWGEVCLSSQPESSVFDTLDQLNRTNGVGFYFSRISGPIMATYVSNLPETQLTTLSWSGVANASAITNGRALFKIRIHQNNNGLPQSTVLHEVDVYADATQSQFVTSDGKQSYVFTADLRRLTPLAAGAYWFSIIDPETQNLGFGWTDEIENVGNIGSGGAIMPTPTSDWQGARENVSPVDDEGRSFKIVGC